MSSCSLVYLAGEDCLCFLQQLAQSCGSSGGQLTVDDTICTHICYTHVLIGGIHLEATERFIDR